MPAARGGGRAERHGARLQRAAVLRRRAFHRLPGLACRTTRSCSRSTTARPDGEEIEVFAREVAAPDGARPAVARLLPGRPGLRGAAARRATTPRLDRARARGLPRPAARPARHRPLDAGRARDARRAEPRRSRPLPAPLPRRLDRARRRADPRASSASRPVERPRPELRRLLRHCPTSRSRPRACTRRSSPAASRRSSAAPTTSTARPTARCSTRTARFYERYPDDRAASAR